MTALQRDTITDDAQAETSRSNAALTQLPNIGVFDLGLADSLSAASADSDAERNTIFRDLVHADTDLVGLLAYSIYKQNKYDFRVAFAAARGRDPTPAELGAYIIGEATPRRLATYRFLANAKLAGDNPEGAPADVAGLTSPAAAGPAQARAAKADWRRVFRLTLLLIVLMAAGAAYLRMR